MAYVFARDVSHSVDVVLPRQRKSIGSYPCRTIRYERDQLIEIIDIVNSQFASTFPKIGWTLDVIRHSKKKLVSSVISFSDAA